MKKKILFLFAGILCLAGVFFSCAADASGDSGNSDSVKGSVVYNVKSASNTEKIILGWQVPSANYFGVQVSMSPAEGTLSSLKICEKTEKTLLVEGLKANTEYSFTFTALDSESKPGSETTTIKIKTLETTPADKTAPAEVTELNAASGDGLVVLTWKNPSDEDFYGVQISAEPAEGVLAKPVVVTSNTFTACALTNEQSYKFTLKTIDDSLNVSAGVFVDGKPVDSSDKTPPEEVTKLELKVADGIAKLTWKDSVSDDVFGYEISYESNKIVYASRSTFSAMAENTVFVSPKTQKYEFEVETGKEYSFTIKAVDTSGNKSAGITKSSKLMDVIEPVPFATRSENLDFIFGTDSVAEITLTIKRSEWNTLLEYYDTNNHNENCIHADFKMTKGEYTWQAEDIGMRLRGNTSRIRPQQGDNYYQAHFKIDFEEWIEDDTIEEGKLAGCMKGIILKRFKADPTYVREVFGYNFFRNNGIWTAPRAGYTRLFINIIEEDGKPTELDYGVYAMIEEINKQFLKERSENTPEIGTKFNGNKGNLWKCCWQSSDGPSMATDFDAYRSFGVEEIFLDEAKSMRYDYDLKTNKDDLISARDEFIDFIYALNDLSTVEEIKAFYDERMDVDLFLKTYACNVLLGMDDDYWNNKNNYYFYFDKKGKCYFIPYDYDNILGTNCFDDTATRNPLEWGRVSVKAPLIEKLLSVPEYKQMYIDYLLELSEESSFVEGSKIEIQRLQAMVKDYVYSPNLTYTNTFPSIGDDTASWCSNYGKYKLLSDDDTNYFKTKARCVKIYCDPVYVNLTLDLNVPSGSVVRLYTEDKYYTEGSCSQQCLAGTFISDNYYYIMCNSYYFDGWYDAPNGGNLVKFVPSSDITLYAHWSPKDLYQITFKLNGGTSSSLIGDTQSLYDGDYLPNFGITKEEDNEFFIGWYDAQEGGNLVEYATCNMTVYAHYRELPYKYWTDESSVTHLSFAFNPEDYFGLSAEENYTVIHACELSGWGESTVEMTKDVDGIYRCEYTSDDDTILKMWPGYKFIVDGDWLGSYDYKYTSYLKAGETYENKGNYNFLIKELMGNYGE